MNIRVEILTILSCSICFATAQDFQPEFITPPNQIVVTPRTELKCPGSNCQLINGLCYCGQAQSLNCNQCCNSQQQPSVNCMTNYQSTVACNQNVNCAANFNCNQCCCNQNVNCATNSNCNQCCCSQNVNCATNFNCNQCTFPNVNYTPQPPVIVPSTISTPTTQPSIPITTISTPKPPRHKTRKSFNYQIHIAPINNTIVNINNITHPIHLNNFNENNIHVYSSVKCPDGSIGMMIRKNNETTFVCNNLTEDVTTTTRRPLKDDEFEESNERSEENSNNFCCDVHTPRRCKKDERNDWRCGHRRYVYCGSFCGARKKIYLQPRNVIYQGSVLIVPADLDRGNGWCTGRHCHERGEFMELGNAA